MLTLRSCSLSFEFNIWDESLWDMQIKWRMNSHVFFFIFAIPWGMWYFNSPTQGSNLSPLHWKRRVLTTEPPRKSSSFCLLLWASLYNFMKKQSGMEKCRGKPFLLNSSWRWGSCLNTSGPYFPHVSLYSLIQLDKVLFWGPGKCHIHIKGNQGLYINSTV